MPNLSQREESATGDMAFRSLEVRASTLNEEARTIEADISTESPVMMPDWTRGEMIPEVLLSSGAQYPKSRQVPFLDSHNRSRVADQLGSARAIEVKGDRIRATLNFSESAANEFTKVREGHVTDVSVGYEILKRVFVPAGESKAVGGRSFDGPTNVVTKWRLREVSLTPIGADAQAKLRGLDPAAFRFESSKKGQFEMNPELRTLLVSRGMAATLTDEEAQRWLIDNADKLGTVKKEEARKEPVTVPVTETRKESGLTAESVQAMIETATRAAIAAEAKRVEAFRKECDDLCDLAGLPNESAHCRTLADVSSVRAHLKAAKDKETTAIGYGPSVRFVSDGFEELRKDMGSALSLRAIQTATTNEKAHEKVMPVANRPKGAHNFRHASIYDMAVEFVRASGIETRGLTREEVAICAMFGPDVAGIQGQRNSYGSAYSTTGSFANLTLDAINKSMQVAYTEYPSTWEGPMRRGTSVADFKNINRIRLGSVANLPVWNDNDNPNKVGFTDAKEVYAVESRSLELDFSYRLLINDDMSALSRGPALLGASAKRTVNAVAWSQITSNPTMGDGVALFSAASGARKRSNLTTGAATPTVTTLQTLTNLMMQMRGENTPEGAESQDILALNPRYLVGPSALSTTIRQLILSAYDPASSLMVYNTATQLIPVIEPLLDASSTTAFYAFASPSEIDTVEVTFLQGQEEPVTRSFMDERKLSQSVIILQTFGAKPLNHRGIQKHNGV